MPASLNDISTIIPRMIFGIVLIIAWIPVIFFTESNNKGNNEEYKLLLDKIKNNLKFTNITSTITYPQINILSPTYYTIPPTLFSNNNNNLLIIGTKNIKTIDSNGKEIINSDKLDDFYLGIPLVNGIVMDKEDYTYLALFNKVLSDKKTDITNSNITYDLNIYSIPVNKNILKVEGLQEFKDKLDMKIYNYEFGPEVTAIQTIKNRKLGNNTLHMWLGRIGTFLMLFGGLSLLIAPLSTIVELGETLPGPLKILAFPGRFILNIYETLSFFGALILTALMTLFIWTIINHPIISILIGGLIIGLILYFSKK